MESLNFRKYLLALLAVVIWSVNGLTAQPGQPGIDAVAQSIAKMWNKSVAKIFAPEEFPGIYVVSFSPEGFVLLSGTTNAPPVLAFSPDGSFPLPLTSKNTAVYNYLHDYSLMIKHLSGNSEENLANQQKWLDLTDGKTGMFSFTGKGVSPLTTSVWSLGSPWNAACPPDSSGPGGHARVGCLAVAMGQIMKYWQHPGLGQGYHEYVQQPYGLISADFGNTTYDFSQMPDSSATAETARLLFHCGVAVDMHY